MLLRLLIATVLTASAASAQTETANYLSPQGLSGCCLGFEMLLDGDSLFLAEITTTGGIVHVYERSADTWVPVQVLSGSQGAVGDAFGASLQRDGDALVVGAPGDDALGSSAGAAYVFRLQGGSWTEEARLTPGGLEADDFFGNEVAITGDHLLIAAGGDDDFGPQSGSAYAFERVAGTWTQTQKLVSNQPAAGAFFGDHLAMDGDLAVLGASQESGGGAAYVAQRVAGAWQVQQRLSAPSTAGYFGFRVALDGTRLAIGSIFASPTSTQTGGVYLYQLFGSQWGLEASLFPPDGNLGDSFGRALDIEGSRLVVGAPYHSEGFFQQDGATYLFERGLQGWAFAGRLDPAGLQADANAGYAVQIQQDEVLVCALFAQAPTGELGRVTAFQWPKHVHAFCFCAETLAPCGNGDPVTGCATKAAGLGPEGAALTASGSTSVSADDLRLRAANLPGLQSTLLFMGAGSGQSVLGDGLRCVAPGPATGLYRFPVQTSDPNGQATFGPGLVAASSLFPAAAQITAGSTWNFQAWFRSPAGPCATGSNLTHAIEVRFLP